MKLASNFDVYGNKVHIKNDLYVRPEYFDAIANGVTDCTTAIQTALNKATEIGGVVYFGSGTYITSKLTIPSNVKILGTSEARIKAKAGLSGVLLNADGVENVIIENLIIDGNYPNTINVKNHFAVNNFLIQNCQLENFSEYNPIQCFGDNVKIIANTVKNSISADLIAFSSGKGCVIADNILEGASDTDIVVAANAKNVTIIGNICVRNKAPIDNAQSIAIAAADNVCILGNTIIGNQSNMAGIRIYQDPNTQNASSNITINGNIIKNFQQGVVIDECTSCVMGENLIENCTIGGYLDTANTIAIRGNMFSNCENGLLFANDAASKIEIESNTIRCKSTGVTYGIRGVNTKLSDMSVINNVVVASEGWQLVNTTTEKLYVTRNIGLDIRSQAETPSIALNERYINNNPFPCHVYINSQSPISIEMIIDYSVVNIKGNYAYLEPGDSIALTSDVSDVTWKWVGAN